MVDSWKVSSHDVGSTSPTGGSTLFGVDYDTPVAPYNRAFVVVFTIARSQVGLYQPPSSITSIHSSLGLDFGIDEVPESSWVGFFGGNTGSHVFWAFREKTIFFTNQKFGDIQGFIAEIPPSAYGHEDDLFLETLTSGSGQYFAVGAVQLHTTLARPLADETGTQIDGYVQGDSFTAWPAAEFVLSADLLQGAQPAPPHYLWNHTFNTAEFGDLTWSAKFTIPADGLEYGDVQFFSLPPAIVTRFRKFRSIQRDDILRPARFASSRQRSNRRGNVYS